MPVTLVKSSWSSGNLIFTKNGTGATTGITFGEDGTGLDVKYFGDTASSFMLWDQSADQLVFDAADIQLGDNDILKFGDASGGDINIKWNATNLVILPAADDTGAIYFGDGTTDMDVRFTLGTATDYFEFDVGNKALELIGNSRIDLTGATVTAGNTDGGVIKGGTSVAPITEDTADMKFISFYFDNGATSGDSRGIYNRLYITGAGGGGESLRSYTEISNVAAATAHGAHISLGFGESTTSGSITGLGVAGRFTFGLADLAYPGTGTLAVIQSEIYSFGASSDPTGNNIAMFNVGNHGNSTGAADVDDDAVLFYFSGWTVGDGNMIATDGSPTTMPNATHSVKVKLPDGSLAYLYLGATPVTA